ncbi:hypothetical protein HPP92_023720 [Vanilla planifolia]|uniref:Proton pump-interactor 1 n=1 Tax=Vanilla planifolia TaxID=51239 RepID=A0A835UBW8_VANPL|nr:hypothetical protein HPP92_023720 [Vanilla planifolia]
MVMEVVAEGITSGQILNGIDGDGKVENKKILNNADGSEKSGLDLSIQLNNEIEEADQVADSTVPKDAVDEWPAPKQMHSFYFVKYRSFEDPKLKAKIEQADKEVQRKSQARTQTMEALREKKSEKAELISQLKPLQEEEKQFRAVLSSKRKEMEPLQAALGKLRGTKNSSMEKGANLCYSEEELNETIQSLEYRIQHESNTLAVEKQLLKEIKQLEASREKVIASDALRAKIQESFGEKDAIQDQVKLIGADLDGARKEQQAIRMKIQHLEEKLNVVRAEIDSLQEELLTANANRDKAYQTLATLRKSRDEVNAGFFEYRSLMNTVKGLVASKNTAALEELSLNEVEKFLANWSCSKAFRDDYETRVLPSLDMRRLSRDGRMRNADEKPILSTAPMSSEADKVTSKVITKKEREELIPPQKEALLTEVGEQAAVKPEKGTKVLDSEVTLTAEHSEKGRSKSDEVDPIKLKEIKRDEEIAKAKLAMERKKRLAEKAAAKAAMRAQKDAEKKQKEKEKKAKKKAGVGLQPTDAEETETQDVEQELQEETHVNTASAPEKSKEQLTENSVRSRGRSKPKGQNQMPKFILKKRKSHSHWLWAAPAAISALVLVVLGYTFLLGKNK